MSLGTAFICSVIVMTAGVCFAQKPEDAAGRAGAIPGVSSTVFTLGELADAKYDRGIALMYRLRFDEAEEEFKDIIRADTSSPAGYFALAALSWWRCSQNFDVRGDSKALENEFMRNVDATIKVCEARLKTGEAPARTWFFLGGAYGLKGRWYAVQRRWFRAYTNGNKGRKYLGKAVKADPGLYDAYLGLGIFDYFADTLPGVLKIPALLFVRGDRARGIAEVSLAREKGRFFSTEAGLFMVEIMTRHEKDYAAALAELDRLEASDPSNLFFRLGRVLTLIHAREWQKAIDESVRFLAEHKAAPSPGIERQLALIYLSAGDSYLALDRPREAAAWFSGGITETAFPEKGWVTYCYLRRGQALDLLGKREEALRDYEEVLAREDFWDAHKYARAAAARPPAPAEVYRQLTEE